MTAETTPMPDVAAPRDVPSNSGKPSLLRRLWRAYRKSMKTPTTEEERDQLRTW